MNITTILAAFVFASSYMAYSGEPTGLVDLNCKDISKSFRQAVKGKSMEIVLKMLFKEVEQFSDCACELIKAAIAGSKPTPDEVSAMVETAITAAPHRIKEIVNCGIAAAPDAKSGILETARDYGYTPNPLDFPGLINEHPGVPWHYVPEKPIVVLPPQVTPVDP